MTVSDDDITVSSACGSTQASNARSKLVSPKTTKRSHPVDETAKDRKRAKLIEFNPIVPANVTERVLGASGKSVFECVSPKHDYACDGLSGSGTYFDRDLDCSDVGLLHFLDDENLLTDW